MLEITTRNQEINVEHWVMMLYGQPSTGKTSIAFTTSKPLVIDFDNGAYRSEFRKDVVKINGWSDIQSISESDVAGYDTICIDTAGRMLDHLAAALVQENSKWGTRAGGLTLQGYGVLKSRFGEFIKLLRSFNRNILFLAHEKEERNGDNVRVRPDIQGGSFGEVFKVADQVGYMCFDQNGARILDWNPCEAWYGKNTAQIAKSIIPNFHTEPDYLEKLGQAMLVKMNSLSEESKKFADDVAAIKKELDTSESIESVNGNLGAMLAMEEGSLRAMARHLLSVRANELGFKYDKEVGSFVVESKEEAA